MQILKYRINITCMSASIAPCGSNLLLVVAPGRPCAMVARSGADSQMEEGTKPTKRRKPKRNSDQGEEAERADPQSVKQEERSDAGKQQKPRRRVEEGVPKESKRKTAVAVVDKAAQVVAIHGPLLVVEAAVIACLVLAFSRGSSRES